MSQIFESAEQSGLAPIDHVRNFYKQNDELLRLMLETQRHPSQAGSESIRDQVNVAKDSLSPLVDSRFFEGQDTIERDTALNALLVAASELVHDGELEDLDNGDIRTVLFPYYLEDFIEYAKRRLDDGATSSSQAMAMRDLYNYAVKRALKDREIAEL
jgi:hypothetical protein